MKTPANLLRSTLAAITVLFVAVICASTQLLWADDDVYDGPPRPHYPESFPVWTKAVNGISLSVDFKPLSSPTIPSWPYLFTVCVRNDSEQPVFSLSYVGGRNTQNKLKIIDKLGHTFVVTNESPKARIVLQAIGPHNYLFLYLRLKREVLNAIGNNDLTVLVEIVDKPSPKDAPQNKFTVESLPVKVYPLGPEQTPLPPEPVMAQWELEAGRLKDALDGAISFEGQSEAAHQLADYYIQMGKFSEIPDLLTKISDPFSRCYVKVGCAYNDPAFSDSERIDQLQALAIQYPKEQQPIEQLIKDIRNRIAHPELYLP